MTSHQGQVSKSKGHPRSPCASNLVQFRLLFTKLRYLEKNGTRHFSLIGRHLESVGRTVPVFKLTLAPSEKWPTQEISARFWPFFLSGYRINLVICDLPHLDLKILRYIVIGPNIVIIKRDILANTQLGGKQ